MWWAIPCISCIGCLQEGRGWRGKGSLKSGGLDGSNGCSRGKLTRARWAREWGSPGLPLEEGRDRAVREKVPLEVDLVTEESGVEILEVSGGDFGIYTSASFRF